MLKGFATGVEIKPADRQPHVGVTQTNQIILGSCFNQVDFQQIDHVADVPEVHAGHGQRLPSVPQPFLIVQRAKPLFSR